MTRYSRSDWHARTANPALVRLDPAKVKGLALHWPASTSPLTTVEGVMAALRGWQNYHMDGHGWSDIAYQEAIDQAGNVYRLRGLRFQSAANGNQTVNQSHGAILLIVAQGEKPSEAMLKAAQRRLDQFRRIFPKATALVGHGDIAPDPTACPGPAIEALIKGGRLK